MKRRQYFLIMCALLFAFPSRSQSQFAVEPQAKTPEEFDAYLRVLSKTSPTEIITAGSSFTHEWPGSELCAHVYEVEMEAYRALDDSKSAIRSGEKALQGAPNNLEVLAQLAYILADSSSSPQQLSRAQDLAQREFEAAKRIKLPRSISPDQWEQIQGRLGSIAHSALGLVAYKRGSLADATSEFEIAASTSQGPDPALHYRLGSLYRMRGYRTQAIKEFQKTSDSGDPIIRPLAQQQLKELESGELKR
jgi:tetratricopeptide (TPR) repeat protein